MSARKTHCKRGHELAGANVQWSTGNNGKPQRSCKKCHATAKRARYANNLVLREREKDRKRTYMRQRRAAAREQVTA